MTDERESPLTPAQEEVRDLLAEARHTEPMPPEVEARLDRVLADLASEPARRAPVVQLASRRRRVASLLVAAAAVVVVGVGIGQVVDAGSDSDDAGESSMAEEQDAPAAQEREAAPSTPGELSGGSDSLAEAPAEGTLVNGKLIKLRPQSLSADLTRVQARVVGAEQYSAAWRSAFDAAGVSCRADEWGQGTFVPVRYGQVPAVLVFRRVLGDTQVADVFLCGSPDPVRSVTLPAP